MNSMINCYSWESDDDFVESIPLRKKEADPTSTTLPQQQQWVFDFETSACTKVMGPPTSKSSSERRPALVMRDLYAFLDDDASVKDQ